MASDRNDFKDFTQNRLTKFSCM